MMLKKSLFVAAVMSCAATGQAASTAAFVDGTVTTVPVAISGAIGAKAETPDTCNLDFGGATSFNFDLSNLPGAAPADVQGGTVAFNCDGGSHHLGAATSSGYSGTQMAVVKYLTQESPLGTGATPGAIPVAFQNVQVNFYMRSAGQSETNLKSARIPQGDTATITAKAYGTDCYVDLTTASETYQSQFEACNKYFQDYQANVSPDPQSPGAPNPDNFDPRFHGDNGPMVEGKYVTYSNVPADFRSNISDMPDVDAISIVFTIDP